MSASEDEPTDVPEIPDQPGRWDERVAYVIVSIPFVAVALLLIAYIVGVATGSIPAPPRQFWLDAYADFGPLVVRFGALLIGLTYLLAVMKLFGSKPVVWLADRLRGAVIGTRDRGDGE